MTRNQKMGIVAIIVGIAIFVPLLFSAVRFSFTAGGVDITDAMVELGAPAGFSFLQLLEHIGDMSFWILIAQLGTIALILCSIGLVVIGVLFVCNQAEGLAKWFKKGMMNVGQIAAVVALAVIFNSLLAAPEVVHGVEGRDLIGFGSIILLLVGVAVFLLGMFHEKILGTTAQEQASTPTKDNAVDTTPKGEFGQE